jgi:hypothetical protein
VAKAWVDAHAKLARARHIAHWLAHPRRPAEAFLPRYVRRNHAALTAKPTRKVRKERARIKRLMAQKGMQP